MNFRLQAFLRCALGAFLMLPRCRRCADSPIGRGRTSPVKLMVPFSPGGSTDTLGRLIGRHLSTAWASRS